MKKLLTFPLRQQWIVGVRPYTIPRPSSHNVSQYDSAKLVARFRGIRPKAGQNAIEL
jgi:hypothetical protein